MEILIRGIVVPPETFESATVAFTAIWQFSELVSIASPLQIVKFLSEFFGHMDTLLSMYDVYKVETIKDSYMVIFGFTTPLEKLSQAIVSVACEWCSFKE